MASWWIRRVPGPSSSGLHGDAGLRLADEFGAAQVQDDEDDYGDAELDQQIDEGLAGPVAV
ncbi:hypothetical protein SUDANB105_07571 [Streptomyces sp. enrichment culture]